MTPSWMYSRCSNFVTSKSGREVRTAWKAGERQSIPPALDCLANRTRHPESTPFFNSSTRPFYKHREAFEDVAAGLALF